MPVFAAEVNPTGEMSPPDRPRGPRALKTFSAECESVEADARLYAHYEAVLDRLADEEESALRQREECYALADALLADAVASARYALGIRRLQDRLRARLVAAGAYYITPAQACELRARALIVGADIPRYCAYMEVASLEDMPRHLLDEAMAALEAKRAQGRA